MKSPFRRAFTAILTLIAGLVLLAPGPTAAAAEQGGKGTVKVDSLQIYSRMTAESEEAGTLVRGVVVRVDWSATNDEGAWCSVSSLEPAAKLGYVRCDGLERQPTPSLSSSAKLPDIQQLNSGSKPLTQQRRAWALAASALLNEFNHKGHDTLAGVKITEKMKESEKASLVIWWNVHNREELLNAFTWLEEGGHRQYFTELGEHAARMDQAEFDLMVAKLDPEQANSLKVARRYYQQVGEQSLIGWDYARYISLCRWGYLVGYLSEDEAWQRIMPAARIVQSSFSSWRELGENYLIGREFWLQEQTQKDGQRMRATYTRLLSDANSPWNRISWSMNLQ